MHHHVHFPRVGQDWGPKGSRYRLKEVLGNGAFGRVYEAVQLRLERSVALKLVPLDRRTREDWLATRVDHPHIVPVYDCVESEGFQGISMMLVRGTDLWKVLDREHPLSFERALDVMLQVVEALDTAHAQGLLHRGLKPGNILVERLSAGRDHAYLSDFGLARMRAAPSTHDGAPRRTRRFMGGTPAYAAPEQWGGRVGRRSDLYAVGCVLYEILTKELPFEPPAGLPGDERNAWFEQMHRSAPRPRVSSRRRDVPPQIDDVLAKAMAIDLRHRHRPADRTTPCSELYDQLRWLHREWLARRLPTVEQLERLRRAQREREAAAKAEAARKAEADALAEQIADAFRQGERARREQQEGAVRRRRRRTARVATFAAALLGAAIAFGIMAEPTGERAQDTAISRLISHLPADVRSKCTPAADPAVPDRPTVDCPWSASTGSSTSPSSEIGRPWTASSRIASTDSTLSRETAR